MVIILVNIIENNKKERCRVHRLLALTFIDNPNNYKVCRPHKQN
jgi:hypothetical protein